MLRGTNAGLLERFSHRITKITGSTPAFVTALGVIVVWGVTGPVFGFSNTWQLAINSVTTIVTFLMVFLIQRGQNKDALAIQLKLNELVAAIPKASNRLIDAEDFDEHELEILHRHYEKLADQAKRAAPLEDSHSLEQASARGEEKRRPGK